MELPSWRFAASPDKLLQRLAYPRFWQSSPALCADPSHLELDVAIVKQEALTWTYAYLERARAELARLRARRANGALDGVYGAIAGYTGGRPRSWSPDAPRQARLEKDVRDCIDDGMNDSQIADLIFGDKRYYKRIERFRKHL
jgi:hypothetical protein